MYVHCNVQRNSPSYDDNDDAIILLAVRTERICR